MDLGVRQAFTVTGGAAMHLNIALGRNPQVNVTYMHHEQACSMAAEGYARITDKPAIVNVTSGPGTLNSLNGIFGAYTDSVPMIILAGQTRSDTLKDRYALSVLRQLGDQEVRSHLIVGEITKAFIQISAEDSFFEVLDKIDFSFHASIGGRPGPVWIEIPVDVQAREFSDSPLPAPIVQQELEIDYQLHLERLKHELNNANRPIFMFGTGVRIAKIQEQLISIAKRFSIPIVTAWTHDTIESDNDNFVGRAGTIGTRPGNICVQQSDLLVVFGSRLNIRQISYNWLSFAKNARIIQIDIDKSELEKPFPRVDVPILADLKSFIPKLLQHLDDFNFKFTSWLSWCKDIKVKFDITEQDYAAKSETINAYHLIPALIDASPAQSVVVCGNATACIVPFQTARISEAKRMFSNSGSASMGYDLPAAIGASIGGAKNVLCFAGDGSLMMNIQELQTLQSLQLQIKLVVLDNGGYLSIKQTQENFFGTRFGADNSSGVTFPDFDKVAKAFELETLVLDPMTWRSQIKRLFSIPGPVVVIAKLDPEQEFEPRLKSRMHNGRIETPELDDMFPFLNQDIINDFRNSPLILTKEKI